jgi:DNA polymerase-3 subunit beta
MATAPTETAPKRRGRPPKAKPDAEASPPEGPAPGETPPPPATDEPADTRRRVVRVRAGVLRAALKDVAGAVSSKSEVIPILSHVLVEAGDGRIALTATDLDVWAERDCATDDRDGPGSAEWLGGIRPFAATLPAKPLQAILGELDDDAMVTLEIAATAANADQAIITAGRAAFKLHCLPAVEFPLPKPFASRAAFELNCAELAGAFARVEHGISNEETRYYLNGVHVHTHQDEGEALDLRLVTTDGHRLARLRIEPPDGASSFPATIIQKNTVALLDKLLASAARADDGKTTEPAKVLVEIDGEDAGATLRFSLPAADGGDVTVTAKSIDGTFPDYQRVIPGAPANSFTIARTPLLEAVRRVGVLASDRTRAVKALLTADKLELVVSTPEVGEAREELACIYEGPDATIGFNGQFWREALAALASDEVSMAFDADGAGPFPIIGPVLVRAAGGGVDRDALVQVLMPMRVA